MCHFFQLVVHSPHALGLVGLVLNTAGAFLLIPFPPELKGYRADGFTKVETLVFLALREREHAVFCRRLAAQIDNPRLRSLVETIATDEERHLQFFENLVRESLRLEPEETIAAIARRASELQVVGADIDAYKDKVANVADAGIFDEKLMLQGLSDSIAAWGLSDRAELADFVR